MPHAQPPLDLEPLTRRLAETLGSQASTAVDLPHHTVRPATDAVDVAPALALLARLQRDPAAALAYEGTLGEGGMGRVMLATQVALGRKVAVKSLKAPSPHGTRALLREAWVTGALEHPNVVPVYDISLDAQGAPRIVLKRIEGEPWARLLGAPERVRARFGVDDPLEWHLRTLMQVCTAVHYAHSRGIVHRDLKPENVMIGAYGEVYVVDWGIAVSLRDDGTDRLPLAREATALAGTPVYMAPEMLRVEDGAVLSERTDVYLLGAILYELIAHRPPHDAGDLPEIVDSVLRSEPVFPPGAPPNLVSIARTAMARLPVHRYPAADALRTALQRHLEHRGSMLLSAQAERRLAELTALLDRRGGDDDPVARYRLFGECRFGFRQALAEWPDNARAADGLRWATRAMIEHALRLGDPKAASALLGELSPVPVDLRGRVEAGLAEQAAGEARVAQLERLEADLDPSVGQRTRTFFMMVMGACWTLSPALRSLFVDGGITYTTAVGGPLLFMLLGIALTIWARESMGRTAINRRMLAIMFATFGALVLNDLLNRERGIPVDHSLAQHIGITALAVTCMVISVDRRLWPAAVLCTAFYVAAALSPRHVNGFMALANGSLTVNAIWAWFPRGEGLLDPRRWRPRGDQ